MVKIEVGRKNNPFIISFVLYLALMLFQTPIYNLGTISAFVSIVLVIVFAFFSKIGLSNFRVSKESFFLILFLLVTGGVSLVKFSELVPLKLVAQIVLFIVVSSVQIDENECKIICWTLCVSITYYSILVLISANSHARYIHGTIKLFQTEFDPNYIAIPMVCATVLLLDLFLGKKKRLLCVVLYSVNIVAIIYTASRGATVGLITSNMWVIMSFIIKNKAISRKHKIQSIFLLVILVLIGADIICVKYPNQWARMVDIDVSKDNGRLNLWRESFEVWMKAPIFGNGYGSWENYGSHVAHNTYITLLSENGFLGFVLFGAFLVSFGKKILHNENKAFFALYVAVLIQIMFLSAIDNRCVWCIWCSLELITNRSDNTDSTIIGVKDDEYF